MPLYDPCQAHNVLSRHAWWKLGWYHFSRRTLGLRGQCRRFFARRRFGEPSRYAQGEWVQILDKEGIARTLDERSQLRGLVFLPSQWLYCGGVYRVKKVMRRLLDAQAIFRPISRTLLLEGIDCGGPSGTEGCGRHCSLMFRDEWVKPAPEPVPPPPAASAGTRVPDAYMRVRPAGEIRATLDFQGKKDGLRFMPEMERWAGMRFRVAGQLTQIFEFGTFAAPPRPIYILEGLRCSGAVLGRRGPCDLACAVFWHADWVSPD